MKPHLIQFAVVREDPEVEAAVMKQLPPKSSVMLIGSGGCTALTLLSQFDQASLTLLEPNPSQIDLIKRKMDALKNLTGKNRALAFGIEHETPETLTACGNFESLFRNLRLFLYEFVMEQKGWVEIFQGGGKNENLQKIFAAKYWPIAFQLFFSDSLLNAMFGREATQYAAPDSYPPYFQKLFEKGLQAPEAQNNYFLHHVFLGYYLNRCLPHYLTVPFPTKSEVHFENCAAQDLSSYSAFDLVSFSNIFDWMNPADQRKLIQKVKTQMKPGAWLLYRQLNNEVDLEKLFGPEIHFDRGLANELHARDRSLFYSSLHLGRKKL